MRSWQADDGTTSIVIGPAKKPLRDETEKEFELKAGTIMPDRLKKDEAQSTVGRAYAIAVDAAQAQTANAAQVQTEREKLVRALQIVRENQQEAIKKGELEKKLAQLKAELDKINRQVEKKDAQVKLEKEMQELETVLRQLNKSSAASDQALQKYMVAGKALDIDHDKALVDLRREQNQLKILLADAKKGGDQKKAAELEKLIELYVVRKDQARTQADPAARQYRVAAAATSKPAVNAPLTTAYPIAPPAPPAVKQQSGGVLVIPGREPMDAEEYKLVVENMQTMALILEKKLDTGKPAAGVLSIYSSS